MVRLPLVVAMAPTVLSRCVNITEHFRLIWRRRWIILGLSALIAGAVFLRSYSRATVYASSATLDVLSNAPAGAQPLTQEQVDIVTARYAAFAGSSPVLNDAINSSGLDISLATARQRVSAAVPSDPTGFITVRVTGPTPAAARSLTQGVVDALQTAGFEEQNAIQVVTGATAGGAVAPTPERDALLAFLIALVVNAELFALFGYLAGRFTRGHESEEVELLTGLPVLALVPRGRAAWAAEAFRTLRAGVDLLRSDPPVRAIAIVAAEPGSGASFVAYGLAQASANLKMGVVLVDANLRRPTLAAELHVPEQPGLVEALDKGTVDLDDLPQANPLQQRFRILPAGEDVHDPPGVLGSGALRKTLDQLDAADQVVVDSPAADESIDALVIASQCDAAILVVDAQRGRRHAIENAVSQLNQANVELLGVVMNRVEVDERTRPPRRQRRQDSPPQE
jgi:capsular exopolysaccharide synthesis family protein